MHVAENKLAFAKNIHLYKMFYCVLTPNVIFLSLVFGMLPLIPTAACKFPETCGVSQHEKGRLFNFRKFLIPDMIESEFMLQSGCSFSTCSLIRRLCRSALHSETLSHGLFAV